MVDLLKNSAQFLTKPLFTIFFFSITLFVFLFHTLNYNFIVDDYLLLAITQKHSYLGTMNYLYTYINGRWFSNFLVSVVFGTLGTKSHLYWTVQLSQFILFIISVSYFLRSVFKTNLIQSIHTGTFFTCLFYWFCFDARVEIWYWEASCLVTLVCLICIFFLYGIVYREKIHVPIKIGLTILLSLFIGSLSETFAFASVIVSLYLIFRNKTLVLPHILIVIFTGISLAINYFSPGTHLRSYMLPVPEVALGLKNTLYSFYLQFAKLKYLPFRIGGLFLLWPLVLLIKNYTSATFSLTKPDYALIMLLVLQNTFIPAFLISFETPDRIFALNWILLLLLLLNWGLKKQSRTTSS